MKYVQINAFSNGWAPSIIFKKHDQLRAQGHDSYVFWARGAHKQDVHMQKFAGPFAVYVDAFQTHIDGKAGFHSTGPTKRLIKQLEKIDPDVVHLHVLLRYSVNINLLFQWLATHRCKVIWTLHDCWAFTGHCIYFTQAKCSQWKQGCCADGAKCPQEKEYPKCWFRPNVAWNYQAKRRLFTMLPPERLSFQAPSQWLAGLLKESFLKDYDVTVVPNSINTSIFRPQESRFKEDHGIGESFAVLGVSDGWTERKGLDDFLRLANELDERFSVVVVGLTNKQIKRLGAAARQATCAKLILLPRTATPEDLARIYAGCDVLFNPTQEDNYPTVNLEAEACGTPVITYDVGGCRETIKLPTSCAVRSYEEAKRKITQLAPTRR
ncbi:MAG: glycosyltransferase [Coriobacteriia bacterium]|nr:glycosyltransferase [Coriobacteriia bacterium]